MTLSKTKVGLIIVIVAIAGLACCKDRLAFYAAQKTLRHFFPAGQLRVQKMIVWPGYIRCQDFHITRVVRGLLPLEVKSGTLTMRYTPWRLFRDPWLAISGAELVLGELKVADETAKDVFVSVQRAPNEPLLTGICSAREVDLGDIHARRMSAKVRIDNKAAYFYPVHLSIFDGTVVFGGRWVFSHTPATFDIISRLDNIETKELIKDFRLQKRMAAQGRFSGDISLSLAGPELSRLRGEMNSEGSGTFALLETNALKQNIAKGQAAGQVANIVVENLKNYHYDIGNISISNTGSIIQLNVDLEGKEGHRHLEINWHT